MKILFVLDNGYIGGAEKLTINLAEKIVSRGHETAVLILGKNKTITTFTHANIPFLFAARRWKLDIFYFINMIIQRIHEYRPGYIVAHGLFSYTFIAGALRVMKLKVPLFLMFHDIAPFSFRDRIFDWLYMLVLHIFKGKWLILYPGQEKILMKRYFLKSKDTQLIRSGVDTVLYAKNFSTDIPMNGYKENIFTIAHIASLKPIKNQRMLFSGLSIFNSYEKAEWQLFIAGEKAPGIIEEYKKDIKKLGIAEKVTFLGILQDVRTLLTVSDVFVLTSLSEAFPLSALEALSMGVACILPRVGGCSSIVSDGDNGYLIDPKKPESLAQALRTLYCDRQRLHHCKARAREIAVTQFSLDRAVDDVLNVCLRQAQR